MQRGFSPLYTASEYGHTEVVDVLLNSGADVHQATTKVHNPHCMHIVSHCLCVYKASHYFQINVRCEGAVEEMYVSSMY